MKRVVSKAFCCVRDKLGIVYRISEITQTIEGDDFSYSFIPNYAVIDLIPQGVFQGIQGLDLSLRETTYYREGIPSFIAERVPPKNRIGLAEILASLKMDYWDPLTYLLRTRNRYWGDGIYLEPYQEKKTVAYSSLLSSHKDSYASIKALIEELAEGNEILLDDQNPLTDLEKKALFQGIYPLYSKMRKNKEKVQLKTVKKRKESGSYQGRKPLAINEREFLPVAQKFRQKEISLDEALRLTAVSRASFFRLIKKYQNKNDDH
jgi:hypothetical protein